MSEFSLTHTAVSLRNRPTATIGVVVLLMMITTHGGAAPEDGFAIIVNPANPASSLPRAQVDAMYLGKITLWQDGAEVVPVNHRNNEIRDLFSQSIHAKPERAVAAYWAAKSFKDATPPPVRLEDAEIISFVIDNPGAIAYVGSGIALQGVKRLSIDG